jgi:hypothetical protein
MSELYKRNDTVEAKFVFLDAQTNEPIDILNPQYRIVYYVNNQEIVLVDETTLVKITPRIGEYLVTYQIASDALENETYYIYATGNHPIDNSNAQLEYEYRVVSTSFFGKSNSLNVIFDNSCCNTNSSVLKLQKPEDHSGFDAIVPAGFDSKKNSSDVQFDDSDTNSSILTLKRSEDSSGFETITPIQKNNSLNVQFDNSCCNTISTKQKVEDCSGFNAVIPTTFDSKTGSEDCFVFPSGTLQ